MTPDQAREIEMGEGAAPEVVGMPSREDIDTMLRQLLGLNGPDEPQGFFPGEPDRIQTDEEAIEAVAQSVLSAFYDAPGRLHVQNLEDHQRLTLLTYRGFVEAAEMIRKLASVQHNDYRRDLEPYQSQYADGWFARDEAQILKERDEVARQEREGVVAVEDQDSASY